MFRPDAQQDIAARLKPLRQMRDVDARVAGKQGSATVGHRGLQEIHARRAYEAGLVEIAAATAPC
ncbi:hypothetical protein AJ88_31235 [Mesorhizobium amorphae CCBAU 01583]|nr:hypothetical protein AJ88_31235 [Mesorhizobium amorphae CCBAU 01583]